MYVTKTPAVVKALYRSLVWNMPRNKNEVYLTFDDGPHPEITLEVLSLLEKHKAKASFFCVGENIVKFPQVFEQIKKAKHTIGNHTYNHLNGWVIDNTTYFENVSICQQHTGTKYFRPPYGKITRSQAKYLNQWYKIIMWDVLSADFDSSISKEKCLGNVIHNVKNGSIVVFHDSEKAYDRMIYSLEKTLAFLDQNNFKAVSFD